MELKIFKKQRELYSKLNEVEKLIKSFPEKNSSFIVSKILEVHNFSFELFDEFEKAFSITLDDPRHNKFIIHFNDIIQNIDYREKMFSSELSGRLENYHSKTQKDIYFDEKNEILSEYIDTLNSLIHNLNKYVRTLVPEKTQSIKENPASKSDTNQRYQALLKYIENDPVKDQKSKLYRHFLDWKNYFNNNKKIPTIKQRTIDKFIKELTPEALNKLKNRAKYNV
jgi:hypothetical protein